MSADDLIIVGRVRKSHGVRGDLVVEPITDDPDGVFVPGRKLVAGTVTGDPAKDRRELTIASAPLQGRLHRALRRDRPTASIADTWRDRYLLLPADELEPLGEDEVYVHDLLGMRVELESGEPSEPSTALYELPQGLTLDVLRENGGSVLIPFDRVVTSVDRDARVIRIDPPAGCSMTEAENAVRMRRDERRPRAPLRINVVTIFPEFFTTPLGLSIPSRAREAGGVEYRVVDLRDFTHDRHRTVDDYPYGGGAGMVMKPGPVLRGCRVARREARRSCCCRRAASALRRPTRIDSREGTELTLLCGHYKDVDQRVADHLATEELSLGDFVLSGGEPAALARHRRDGAAAARRDVRPRQRAHRFVLRSRIERAELYAAAGVPRAHAFPMSFSPATTRKSRNGGSRSKAARRKRRRANADEPLSSRLASRPAHIEPRARRATPVRLSRHALPSAHVSNLDAGNLDASLVIRLRDFRPMGRCCSDKLASRG